MNSNLRVPIARRTVTNEFILPSVANKALGPFCCVQCGHSVILRSKSLLRCAHFAHVTRAGKKPSCSGESAYHLAAKFIIATHFRKFVFHDVCSICKCALDLPYRIQTANDSKLEYRVDRFIVDVALLTNTKLEAIVEIHHTHPVDKPKWNTLHEKCSKVFEVRAKDVINVYEKDPFAEQFEIMSQTNFEKMCTACFETNSVCCQFCNKRNLKKHMHEFASRQWSCEDCKRFVRDCCFCKSTWCFKTSLCKFCKNRIQNMFPKHDSVSQLQLFILFRRIMRALTTRWAIKLQHKQQELTFRLETQIAQLDLFPLNVPKRDRHFAISAGCSSKYQSSGERAWSVSGNSVWQCYRWWPNRFEKFLLSKIARKKVFYVGIWNDDKKLKQLCTCCAQCKQYFWTPKHMLVELCIDCDGLDECAQCFQHLKIDPKTKSVYCSECHVVTHYCKRCDEWKVKCQDALYCEKCMEFDGYTRCPRCHSWHIRVNHYVVHCNVCLSKMKPCLICKKPNSNFFASCCPTCTRNCAAFVRHVQKIQDPCDLFFFCKRILKRFVANCRAKLAHRAQVWFSEAFETNKLIKLRVPKRHGIFLSLTGCHFDKCWQAYGEQLWMYARWLPRVYLRNFAYEHRPQTTIAFWDDVVKLRALEAQIKPWIGKNQEELFRELNTTTQTQIEQHNLLNAFIAATNFLFQTEITDQLIVEQMHNLSSLQVDMMQFLLVATRIPPNI